MLVRRLDGEEPGQRPLAGGVGVVRLRQTAVGPPDLVGRRTGQQPEGSPRIGRFGHRAKDALRRADPPTIAELPRERAGPDNGRIASPVASANGQISSLSGASSNSAMASAPIRPWGSTSAGRW
jgi:hypothetical protein